MAGLQKEIESLSVRYEVNESKLMPGQEEVIEALMQRLIRLEELVQQTNQSITVKIIGHTDSSGTNENNQALSQGRATHAKTQLEARARLLKKTRFVTEGVKDQQAVADSPEANRRVTFKIEMSS